MKRPILFLLCFAGVCPLFAQEKAVLDHGAYDVWRFVDERALSRDGQWARWTEAPEERDGVLHLRAVSGEAYYRFARGRKARFTADGRFAVFVVAAPRDSVLAAKRAERKPEAQPKDSLAVVDLATGQAFRAARVKSFELPEEAGGWVAYLHEPDPAKKDTTAGPDSTAAPAAEGTKKKKEKKKEEGSELVLRALATGAETRFAHAVAYRFSEDGRWLVYAASNKRGDADGVYAVETATGRVVPVLTGRGVYKGLALDEQGTQLAFVSDRDSAAADQPSFALYHARLGALAEALVREGASALPAGWWVSEHGEVTFSKDGRRLFFGTAPRPAPDPEDDRLPEELAKLDVWSWTDPFLQPMQLEQSDRETKRSYLAVVHLAASSGARRVVQLATADVPDVAVGDEGRADVALGHTDLPYRALVSWEYPASHDVYLVDVATGARRLVLRKLQGRAQLSPGARYVAWWDRAARAWYTRTAAGDGEAVKVTAGIPHPVHDELHDVPAQPDAYGLGGWTDGDAALLVYDAFDVWAVDPAGRKAPHAVTEGEGRRSRLRLRPVDLDPEARTVDPKAPLLFSAFDLSTKASGFYRDRVEGDHPPERLLLEDRRFTVVEKARGADVLLFSAERFDESPDLWAAALDLTARRRLSDANPQQAQYRWGTAELVAWTSLDGVPLQGLLFKPEGFDPARTYPMMVYFYERNADYLHAYRPPQAGRSIISVSFYVSRGYVVFIPDIPYKAGFPGESAVNAVLPGVTALIDRGFVDRARIGVQGHSWGGYQIAYLLTQTNLFAAAEAGAPVANMVSAYGGIRWGTGMSRMFQYEQTQSRIGGSLWERPLHYLHNSPILQADKITTPLLMMHNDKDDAVPWYQGIELFVALRRLGKPVWLLNYNDELHGLQRYPNKRDFAVRMQQFFDHYLQGAPAPAWMTRGVPAVDKGRTYGLELPEPVAVPVETN